MSTFVPSCCLIMMAEMTLFIDVSHFEATIMVALTSMLVKYTLYQSIGKAKFQFRNSPLDGHGYKLADFVIFPTSVAPPLRAISRARNVNKTQFLTQCATCLPFYASDQTIVSSPYRPEILDQDNAEESDIASYNTVLNYLNDQLLDKTNYDTSK